MYTQSPFNIAPNHNVAF